MNQVPVVTSPRVELLKAYIANNRGECNRCHKPIFWADTAKSKRIPMNFPDSALYPQGTHRLVLGYKDGVWDGTVEAWPKQGTGAGYTCHLDTCGER